MVNREMKKLGLTMLLGVSPIPIAGEIALSKSFYDILNGSDVPLFKGSKFQTAVISGASALLTRIGLYKGLYIPLAQKLLPALDHIPAVHKFYEMFQ